jgi:SprT protein
MRGMRFFKQLEFILGGSQTPVRLAPPSALFSRSSLERSMHFRGRDRVLEFQARELLGALGAEKLAREIRVEWNLRLKTCAGRADYREKLVSLNLELLNLDSVNGHSGSEVDRTLRHELAHLLAQSRVGRRRIAPHGAEWRQACVDLGIADEARCHNLPFATKVYPPRHVYVCPNCKEKFPRVRRIRRAIACLACCRKHTGGDFDQRFRLRLISSQQKEAKERKILN